MTYTAESIVVLVVTFAVAIILTALTWHRWKYKLVDNITPFAILSGLAWIIAITTLLNLFPR